MVDGATLEGHVADQVGTSILTARGAFVVLDGLDERFHEIAGMLTQASLFTAAWPRSSVLVTTRPTELATRGFEVTPMPLLAEAEALDLVRTLSRGDQHVGRQWSADLRELIRRPLFALITAQYLSPHRYGQANAAELIDLVITDSAKREGAAFSSALRKIAVATTTTGQRVDTRTMLSAEEWGSVQGSPMLTVDRHTARFTLAVFQQWLAGQALISGEVDIEQSVTVDLVAFDRWRYAVSIALASAPTERFDDIMCHLAGWRPAAAAWVLSEVQGPAIPAEASQDRNQDTANRRIRQALTAWLAGLGPTGKITNHELSETFSEKNRPGLLDTHTFTVQIDGGQVRLTIKSPQHRQMVARPITHSGWPWTLTLDVLADKISRNLVGYIVDSPPEGVVEAEVYRALIDRSPEFPSVEALQVAIDKLDHGELSSPPGYSPEQRTELRNQAQRMLSGRRAAESDLYRWPGPDQEDPTPWHPTGRYSKDRLGERARQILTETLNAYQSIVDSHFPTLSDTLRCRVLMPATLEGDITVHEDAWGPGNHEIWLASWLNPGAVTNNVALTVESPDPAVTLPDEDDRLHRQFSEWLDAHPEARAFAHFSVSHGATEFFGTAPATALAIRWLWDDLKDINLVTGHAPRKIL
ncbi:hypothetical protein [Gordonia sp. SMJS1]|uniref:hypothetical protein n=1 Tax=Gordonia sp. SMJS1 TaxID=3039400 RepID=UPI0024542802|nr:hypothetical protein [Gordonia sp. SMJS1]WGJ88189.1 hypothetical protein QAD21_24700 [Gordonia sp. SMJS1]